MSEGCAHRFTIVRHADAGSRASFDGPDAARPLTKRGRAQARALVSTLAETAVGAVVSSPAVRCVETVTPVAEHLGVAVEVADALGEDSSADAVLAVLTAREVSGVVLASTHGPIFDDLMRRADVCACVTGPRQIPKAGRLELTLVDGAVTAATAFPAPEARR